MIAEVLAEAYRKIKDMDAAAYFELIERLLDHYVLPQEGEIHFSPADAQRMPAGFEAKIQEAARAKGGSPYPGGGGCSRTGRIRAGVRRGRGELYL